MNQKTSLYQSHLDSGAKIVDFGGWDMPIHYGSQIQEHNVVREDAGMFEILESQKIEANIQFAKFIEKKGEGIHHIAYDVTDIEAELKRLKAEGFLLISFLH